MPLVAALLIGLIVLGMIGVVVHRENSNPLLKWMLVSEEHGGVQLASGTVKAGYVYSFGWTDSGWAFQAKTNTLLVDKVELDNIDLSPGDTVAPHLYDLYASPGQYISYINPRTSATNSIAWQMDFKLVSTDDLSNSLIFQPPESPRINAEASTHKVFVFYDNSTNIGLLVTKPSIDMLDGAWHVVAASHYNGLLNAWYDGVQQASDIADNGDAELYSNVELGSYNINGYTVQIAYAIVWKSGADINGNVDTTAPLSDLLMLLDPTFYNGTSYIDLVSGVAGTPYGGVQRVPAEKLWLWQVKQLSSDGKLHFRYFPPGTVIKAVDSNGNVVREWTIPSTDVNGAGLVEDYAVDIGTGLNNVNLTASIPSGKARIYGPPGFTVKVNGDTYSSEYTIPSTGYVDVPIPDGSDTVSLLASGEKDGALGISATSTGDALKVQVYNTSSGVALSGAVVVAKKNNEAASAVTDENGFATVNIKPDAPVTLEVYYLGDSIVYTGSSVYTPPTSNSAAALPEENHSHTALALLILVLLGAAMALLALRGRR